VKKLIFCVLDSKANVFGTPFTQHNEAMALRSFQRAAIDPASDVSVFPDDFALFQLGEYEDDTGAITPLIPVRHICTARQFVHQEK